MNNKTLIEVIRIGFAIASLMFLAPALLPGIEYNGGVVLALVLGLLFYAYQRLWMHLSNRLMGIAEGSCPMPGVMKWVVLSTICGIVLFVAALGLALPAYYAVHGVFSAVCGGLVVLVGMLLSNFFTRPLSKASE